MAWFGSSNNKKKKATPKTTKMTEKVGTANGKEKIMGTATVRIVETSDDVIFKQGERIQTEEVKESIAEINVPEEIAAPEPEIIETPIEKVVTDLPVLSEKEARVKSILALQEIEEGNSEDEVLMTYGLTKSIMDKYRDDWDFIKRDRQETAPEEDIEPEICEIVEPEVEPEVEVIAVEEDTCEIIEPEVEEIEEENITVEEIVEIEEPIIINEEIVEIEEPVIFEEYVEYVIDEPTDYIVTPTELNPLDVINEVQLPEDAVITLTEEELQKMIFKLEQNIQELHSLGESGPIEPVFPIDSIAEKFRQLSKKPYELRYKGVKIFDSYTNRKNVVFDFTHIVVGGRKYPYQNLTILNK